MAINITNASGSSSYSQLAPWQVHKVFMTETSHESKEDKNGKPYHALKITFSNDTGDYTQTLFCPVGTEEMKEGGKRTLSKENSYEQPSREETFIFQLLHVMAAGGESVEGRFKTFYAKCDPTANLASFDKFCLAIEKLLNEVFIMPKFELQLKLSGNKEGYATIPFCVGITKKGDAFVSKQFLAAATARPLSFSAKDLATKARYEAAEAQGASKVGDADLTDDERAAVKGDLDDLDVNDI